MLTSQQNAAVKDFILADPVFSILPHDNSSAFFIAEELTNEVIPEFIVWRTAVTRHEYQTETSINGTNFMWSGAGGYIARSPGELAAWTALFNSTGSVDPSRPNIQAAFNDIFSGTVAGAVNNRAHILALSKRRANRLEKLLSTGAGTIATPATMGYEGRLEYDEIRELMGW